MKSECIGRDILMSDRTAGCFAKIHALSHSLPPCPFRPQGQSRRGEAATPYHFRESGLLDTTAFPSSNAELWAYRVAGIVGGEGCAQPLYPLAGFTTSG